MTPQYNTSAVLAWKAPYSGTVTLKMTDDMFRVSSYDGGDNVVASIKLNNSENPEEVKEEDFKYPGPKPMSKEQGIVMLADSTEAAVRSINEPTEEKIEKMVNNIIDDKLASGQLDNCDLTLRDISKIKKCFLKALNGIHHERIEYPDDNKKEKK